jgi:hypothetical protein
VLVYGTEEHREKRRRHAEHYDHNGDDAMELGRMAVGGMITVGVIGALGNAFRRE